MNNHIIQQQPEIIHNFRRCFLKGCLGMGWHYPVLSFSPDNLQRAYLPYPHILVCDEHKSSLSVDDFISGTVTGGDDAFTRVQEAFIKSGKSAPLHEFTNLVWREG